MDKNMKVLMVCLGNICRSPLAEGILAHKIKTMGLDWEVDSAGTGNWHIGEEPDPRSIEIADKNNLDIRYQRARQIQPDDLLYYDLVLAMDSSNYQDILKKVTPEGMEHKVEMILNYAFPGENRSVPDPYWDDDGFPRVFDMLDKATDRLIESCLTEG